jgi:hypothetical protein
VPLNGAKLPRMIRLVALLAALGLLLAAGCGGDDGGGGGVGVGTFTGALPEDPNVPSAEPMSFESKEFQPAISFELPAGWRINEEFGIIQAFRGSDERWALTFESAADGGEVAAKVAMMRQTQFLDAAEPKEVTIAGQKGQMFAADVLESTTIDGTEYFTIQHSLLRTWVIGVERTLVYVFAEAGTVRVNLRDEEFDRAFFDEVDQILESLEFSPA